MRRRSVVVAAALSVLGVLTLPGVADAATGLADYQPISAAQPAKYRATTSPATAGWTVVGVRSPWGTHHSLSVNGVPSNTYGPFADFVAVDNACQKTPLALTAEVKRVTGTGGHTIELAQGGDRLAVDPLPFPDTNVHIASIFGPGISTPEHFIGVRTVHLVKNRPVEIYAAHVGGVSGEVMVLAPGAAAGCVQSRQQAVAWASVNWGGGAATLRLTPTITADFAVVQIAYGPGSQNGYSSLRVGQ